MHISIDIETLGSGDDAQIIQMSAVAFEFTGAVQEPHELLQLEDRWFDACIEPYYGSQDASNVDFWHSPAAAPARTMISRQPRVTIEAALAGLSGFCGRWLGKRGMIWAKPPEFDCRILRGAHKELRLPLPWSLAQEYDLRVLVWAARKVPRVYFKLPVFDGIGLLRHYALHDAAVQATTAQAAYRALALFTDDRQDGAVV